MSSIPTSPKKNAEASGAGAPDVNADHETPIESPAAGDAARPAGRDEESLVGPGLQAVSGQVALAEASVGTTGGAGSSRATWDLERWNEQVKARMRRQTRRSFLQGGVVGLAGLAGWGWLWSRRDEDGLPWPLRKGLEVNEQLARDLFRTRSLSPSFPARAVVEERVNGDVGLDDAVDIEAWRLRVEGLAAEGPLALTLGDIRKLPRAEFTTELKCVEGWSVVVRWGGARFVDFMRAYPPATLSGAPFDAAKRPEDLPPYVGMETPGGDYYVGLDMESMLHPQTLLCYEMNGHALTPEHGAPLRLAIPVKYGVKNLKRIGTIRYSTRRPADYWAEQGYDWYLGL